MRTGQSFLPRAHLLWLMLNWGLEVEDSCSARQQDPLCTSGMYFWNFFRMIIFPRAWWTTNCVSVMHPTTGLKTAWSCSKPRCPQRATGIVTCRLLPGQGVSLSGCAKYSEAEHGFIVFVEQSCARGKNPWELRSVLGAGGGKQEMSRNFRKKNLLEFQPCSLSKPQGSDPALGDAATKSE